MLNAMAERNAAETLLRSMGGDSATVISATAGSDESTAGLGLGSVVQREWELEPVLVRWKTTNDEKHRELVVGAETLESAFDGYDTENLRSLFLRSQVKTGGETFRVTEVNTERCYGSAYLYRLRLER